METNLHEIDSTRSANEYPFSRILLEPRKMHLNYTTIAALIMAAIWLVGWAIR
jgi:hypothetical protein